MATIVLCGWNVGFNKIALTNLVRQRLGHTLSEAKAVTDTVLAGQEVTLEIADDLVEAIRSELDRIGVQY